MKTWTSNIWVITLKCGFHSLSDRTEHTLYSETAVCLQIQLLVGTKSNGAPSVQLSLLYNLSHHIRTFFLIYSISLPLGPPGHSFPCIGQQQCEILFSNAPGKKVAAGRNTLILVWLVTGQCLPSKLQRCPLIPRAHFFCAETVNTGTCMCLKDNFSLQLVCVWKV